MVLMLCFSTTVVCRSGFRHIGQMGCIQEASLSGVLRFPQGELCQRPEPFGTRPEKGHHYWQLAGVVHLSSRKCSEWHLFCCIWNLWSYLYLITLLFIKSYNNFFFRFLWRPGLTTSQIRSFSTLSHFLRDSAKRMTSILSWQSRELQANRRRIGGWKPSTACVATGPWRMVAHWFHIASNYCKDHSA